jgi:four helix bundle protein
MYKQFHQLSIWQTGASLLEEIYKITKKFPVEEKYALTSQLRRSANSIIANLAEAHGRYFYKDKIRILYIVRGEVEETRSHLLVSYRLNYIIKEKHLEMDKKYNFLSRDINSYIIDLNSKNNDLRS